MTVFVNNILHHQYFNRQLYILIIFFIINFYTQETKYDNCSLETCDVEFTIYSIDENNTVCSVNHNNMWAFNFTCKTIPMDAYTTTVECFNKTLVYRYKPSWLNISTVNITCYKYPTDTKNMYEEGIVFDVEPSTVSFSQVDVFSDSVKVHFEALDKIANLTQVWIDELNTTRHLIEGTTHNVLDEPITILNESLIYDFQSLYMNLDYACQINKIYRVSIEVRNGVFLETFSKDIVVPDLIAKSLKKYYAVTTNPYLVDAYFPYDLLIETANVVNVNFTYHWDYMDNKNETETNTLHIPSMPLIGKCYVAHLTLNSSEVLMVNVNRTICVDTGINGTLNFNYANSFGDASIFEVVMDRFGNSSCIAIDFDGNLFVNSINLCNMHLQISTGTVMTFINNISTVSHVMPTQGDFPLTFMAKNNVHDQLETFIVSVINLTCHVPEINIIGACLYSFEWCSNCFIV